MFFQHTQKPCIAILNESLGLYFPISVLSAPVIVGVALPLALRSRWHSLC
jgi:hypothetical protein